MREGRHAAGRRLHRALGTVAVLVAYTSAAVAGAAEARSATVATPPPGSLAEADRVLAMSYSAFLEYKGASSHAFPFDFSSDGCTNAPTVEKGFDGPCQLHDFGYRNFGNRAGLALGRDDATRQRIDDRFHEEMDRYCDDTYRGFAQQGNNQVCHYRAQVTSNGVHRYGARYFYA